MSESIKVEVSEKAKIAGQVARAHDLLVYGLFSGNAAKDVVEARSFLSELHKKMMEEIESEQPKEEPKENVNEEAKQEA